MASVLYQSIETLSKDKGIDPQIVVGAVEDAIALATRKYYKTQESMRAEMDRLTAKHPSVKEARNIGLFGMVDLRKNSRGDALAPYNGTHPAMARLGKFFRDEGLFTFQRWSSFTANPPLCITQAQLEEGFEIVDRGLDGVDEAFEG
jgi:taurine--2-oxoglutarate transaminase